MKYTIYGAALLVMAVFVIAGTMIISGQDVRENEMDKALNTAVEQTLEQLKQDGGYEVEEPGELIADFQQSLLMHISSDSQLEVKILTADTQKGVLDVEVTERYQTVKGTKKHAVCRKTVILEEYSEKAGYCMVEFLVDGIVHEKYSIYRGGSLVLPPEPEKHGFIFQGWKEAGSQNMMTKDMTVVKDTMFLAVFH